MSSFLDSLSPFDGIMYLTLSVLAGASLVLAKELVAEILHRPE